MVIKGSQVGCSYYFNDGDKITRINYSSLLSHQFAYTIFTANNNTSTGTVREASLGTAIAVHPSIQPYIHTIKQIPGFALLIDFFFPWAKTRIISIYLPSEPTTESRKAQKLIT